MPYVDAVDIYDQNIDDDFWVNTALGQSNYTAWDSLYLAGAALPGVWSIEAESSHDFFADKYPTNETGNSAFDTYQIKIVDKGLNPSTIQAVGRIWTVGQWLLLKKQLPLYWPKKINATRVFYKISHPMAQVLGVDSVFVDRVRLLPPVDQTLFVNISMTEAYPAAQQTKTLGGASQADLFGAAPSPNVGANLA
jgi:hypothetical protein